MFDLDDLLNPITDDSPCGEDLEYDDEFIALEMANKPGEERVIGDAVIPPEEPDYSSVANQAIALLGRTKDLRIAAILANAALKNDNFAAFRDTLTYMHTCLEQHWDSVHPLLDEDDGDPTMRVNAIVGLSSLDGLLRSLRTSALLHNAVNEPLSLRDFEIASGDATPPGDMENPPTEQMVFGAIQEMDPSDLDALVGTVQSALGAVKDMSQVFDQHIGVAGPDLTPLQKMLFDIHRRLAAHTDAPKLDAPAPDQDTDTAPQTAKAQPGGTTAINSTADVEAALERIIAYYARHEPSSPLPILLKRAKRLVSADFLTIMKDMAPEGINNVALIGGFEPNEGEEGTYGYD